MEMFLKIGGKTTGFIRTNKGIWQGCCFSPIPFNICIDDVISKW